MNSDDVSYLESMPYDIFERSVLSGNLSLRDILSLCNSNDNIRKKCNQNNQALFQALLYKDYGISMRKIETEKTPKQLYEELIQQQNIIDFLNMYYPNDFVQLLYYWIKYSDEIIEIFENSYSGLPRWVNYDLFKREMLLSYADTFFGDVKSGIEDEVDNIEIQFRCQLYALVSDEVDTGLSVFADYAIDHAPTMTVQITPKFSQNIM